MVKFQTLSVFVCNVLPSPSMEINIFIRAEITFCRYYKVATIIPSAITRDLQLGNAAADR